ncbi:MAG: hypothetical protein LBQ28_10115 [Prevotellaceae bacterium]|jgi:hypothetical protein|nr:hypothetical protein [Prevotellaceae bacterium]
MKKLLIFVLGTSLCFSAVAQQKVVKDRQLGNNEKLGKEEIIEKKCKKTADKLMLDDAAVAKFTPVYKAYLNEISENIRFKHSHNDDKTSDSEVDKAVQDNFAKARKTVDIREKYYNEFRKFLTAKQAKMAINVRDGKKMKERKFAKTDNQRFRPIKKRLDFSHDKKRLNDENSTLKAE